jgi:hypothetical protein
VPSQAVRRLGKEVGTDQPESGTFLRQSATAGFTTPVTTLHQPQPLPFLPPPPERAEAQFCGNLSHGAHSTVFSKLLSLRFLAFTFSLLSSSAPTVSTAPHNTSRHLIKSPRV